MVRIRHIILVLFFFFVPQCYAQTIDLNTPTDVAISNINVFNFSGGSSSQLKNVFLTNPNLKIDVTNFSGSPFLIAPTADFVVAGSAKRVSTNETFLLDFSMASLNTNSYGLSIVPEFGFSVFKLTASPNPPLSSSSGGGIGTSSSSGGIVSSSSSGGGILVSTSSGGGLALEKPTLTIEGNNALKLKQRGQNAITLKVKASDFKSIDKCTIFTSNDDLLFVKPREFFLGGARSTQIIRVFIPRLFALGLLEANITKSETINVTCQNGASDDFDLTIEE